MWCWSYSLHHFLSDANGGSFQVLSYLGAAAPIELMRSAAMARQKRVYDRLTHDGVRLACAPPRPTCPGL
jgi:hypothetical protein